MISTKEPNSVLPGKEPHADIKNLNISQVESMRKNLEKPARVFKMPYQITCTAFFQGEEERQSLALGLKDGGIVVLDLALGME